MATPSMYGAAPAAYTRPCHSSNDAGTGPSRTSASASTARSCTDASFNRKT